MAGWYDVDKRIQELFDDPDYIPKGKTIWLGAPFIRKLARAAGNPHWKEILNGSDVSEDEIVDWIQTCMFRTKDYYALAKLYYEDADVGRG